VSKVNPVLGEVDLADHGFTLIHEHFLVASWEMRQAFAGEIEVDGLVDLAAAELSKHADRGWHHGTGTFVPCKHRLVCWPWTPLSRWPWTPLSRSPWTKVQGSWVRGTRTFVP